MSVLSMQYYTELHTFVHYKLSVIRIREVSAFERLKCTVYIVRSIRAGTSRPYKRGVRILGGRIREVPLYND